MIHSTQTRFLASKYGMMEALRRLYEGGWRNIDISCTYESDFYYNDGYLDLAGKMKDFAEKHGISFVQAHAPYGKSGWNLEEVNEYLVSRYPRMFEFLNILGVKNVVVHPVHNIRHYGNEDALYETNMEFYSSLVPLAKKYDITIAIENMWHTHSNTGHICDSVCADPEEMIRYYDSLKHHGVFTICLDLGHAALTGREPERVIRTLGERIGCIHAHDVDYKADLHTVPGASKLNWENITRALAEVDYRGSFNLEADGFFLGFPEELLGEAVSFMEKVARVLAERIEKYRK